MKKSQNNLTDAEMLRQKAEEQLKVQQSKVSSISSENDLRKLAHELQVHQIELEMQYEQLKQAKEEADTATQKYIELYDFAPSGYFILTKLGEIIELNLHGARLLGKERLFLINRRFGSSVSDQTKPIFNNFLDKVFESKGDESCELTLSVESKNLQTYVYLTGHVLENGEQCQINVVDITESKQAEKALLESEERFQLLFDNAPLGYQSLDIDGNFIDVNHQWLDTLGYTRDEVIGKWFGDFLSPVYQDGFRKRFPIFRAQGHIHSEFEMVHKNGNILFIAFEGRIGYDKKGEFKQTHCILQDITERTQAEKFLQDIIDYNPLAIQILDTKGLTLKVNQAFMLLYGSKPPSDYSMFNDIQLNEKGFGKLIVRIKNGEVVHFPEMSFNPHDSVPLMPDVPIWVRTIVFPLVDSNGKPAKFVFMHENITKQKQIMYQLQASKDYLNNIINAVGSPVFVKNDRHKFCLVNTALSLFLNLSAEELIGKTGYENFPEEQFDIFIAKDKEVFDTCKENVNEELITDGHGKIRTIITRKTLYTDVHGNKFLVGVINDITERKKAEEEMKQSYVFNETLLKTIPFGMDIVDGTGTILFLSDNFKKVFGESAIGEKCWGLYRDDKKQCSDCPLFKGITIGETETYESHGVLDKRIFEITHTGMMYEGKKAMLEIFQDITERKEYEANLLRAKEHAEESDRLKTAFLTNMSHEIRTPMNGILGFAELLKEPNLTVEEQQDFVQTIGISGARMLSTINNIVDMSRIESGMTKVDLNETNINDKIEFTYKFFKPEVENKGLKFLFKNSLPLKEAIINTDNEKVYAVLTNLVKNAIKFTYEGSIEFGYVLKSDSVPAELLFFVKDTGTGIPENQKELIFERFIQGSDSLTRKYEGSGLGLSICKSYVEMLGGRIWVESEESRGSIFYFTIPYNPLSEEKNTIENVVFAENKEVQLKQLKILIVEDDEISYSLLTRVVQKISKEVIHAITGVEAVEACRNNPDFDLVLMDIRMPQMNGLEATQQIRKFNKDVIIIAQTAYGFSSDCEKALEAGCNDYITKPINKTLLYELIKKRVYRKSEV
jgi:PAS domain S-box-containing protein